MTVWDPNNVIDIGEWWICGGGQLETVLYYVYCIINAEEIRYSRSAVRVSLNGGQRECVEGGGDLRWLPWQTTWYPSRVAAGESGRWVIW